MYPLPFRFLVTSGVPRPLAMQFERETSMVGLREKEQEKLAAWQTRMITRCDCCEVPIAPFPISLPRSAVCITIITLGSGEAADSVNFIEVSSDWRQRVKLRSGFALCLQKGAL